MKNLLNKVLVIIFAFGIISCGKNKTELHVFNWGDYINPDIIDSFEKANNCRVVMDFFDSNEAMYAKLKAGASGYHVIICSSYMAKLMYEQKMLADLDHSKLSNIGNIDKEFLKISLDNSMKYSVPYLISFTGIAYNKTKVTDFKPTWDMFSRDEYKGRMTLLNDVRESVGMALKYKGYSFNSTKDSELNSAKEQLIKWKKNIAKFEVDEAKRGLDAGEFFMIHAYSGDALQLMNENPDMAFAVPVEGCGITSDDMIIPINAAGNDLSYKFINFILEPKVSADNMNYVFYLAPNTEGQKLMDKSFLENPAVTMPTEILNKSEMISDVGESVVKFSKLWDEVKAEE